MFRPRKWVKFSTLSKKSEICRIVSPKDLDSCHSIDLSQLVLTCSVCNLEVCFFAVLGHGATVSAAPRTSLYSRKLKILCQGEGPIQSIIHEYFQNFAGSNFLDVIKRISTTINFLAILGHFSKLWPNKKRLRQSSTSIILNFPDSCRSSRYCDMLWALWYW